MVNPASQWRLAYDILGMIALYYDLIMIPVMIAFEPPDSPFFQGVFWFTLCYWTGDIFASCSVGYYDRAGKLVMNLECPNRACGLRLGCVYLFLQVFV